MPYQISRNGQTYGPYTFEDLKRYVASGNVLPTDLAKSEEMAEWLPVSQILAGTEGLPAQPAAPFTPNAYSDVSTPVAPYAAAAPIANLAESPYPDAPNLHWGLVLLFTCLTCWFFMPIWNLVVNAWLKRVQPNATSLLYYAGAYGLLLVQIFSLHSVIHQMTPGVHAHTGSAVSNLLGVVVWVLRLVARYMERAFLEEHFNGPEPVGLRLDAVMTFFFGGIYFQYKLNEINAMKQAARFGTRAY